MAQSGVWSPSTEALHGWQAALAEDIRALMAAWKQHLATAARIIIQAPSSSAGETAHAVAMRAPLHLPQEAASPISQLQRHKNLLILLV